MLACLTISSDERLRVLARAFGQEFAAAAGVPEDERPGLAGALDDALRFVCERAYPGDPTGRIELTLSLAERGVQVSLHDWGRPLTSAEGSGVLPGLGDAAEDLRLINLGADGKRLSFLWRTRHAADVAGGAAEEPLAAVDAAEAEGVTVRQGRADDAESIAQLLYANYSLSYVHPDFYRPRWLREQLLTGRVCRRSPSTTGR